MNDFLVLRYTNWLAIADILMWIIGSIVICYIIRYIEIELNLQAKWQRTVLGKWIFYYKSKWKYRKETKEEYISHMIYMWRGGFVLDRHIKKLVGDDKFQELYNKLIEVQKTIDKFKI
jgi:hypothetical protein